VTTAEFMARLVREGLGIAMLPRSYTPHLTGVTAIEVTDAPVRVEHVIWRSGGCTPAASAFLSLLGIPHKLGELI
jgi:DNA-binding transcriptional LysR family regulator